MIPVTLFCQIDYTDGSSVTLVLTTIKITNL